MVSGDDRIELSLKPPCKKRISGKRTIDADASSAKILHCRNQNPAFFIPDLTTLAGMRVEAKDSQARGLDPPIGDKGFMNGADCA
jgi:hypothetical protein